MAKRAVAQEKRTIVMIADDDSDVPDALRLIATELEKNNGALARIDLTVERLEGSEELPEPERDEDGNEIAPPTSAGFSPSRRDIRIEAEIHGELSTEESTEESPEEFIEDAEA